MYNWKDWIGCSPYRLSGAILPTQRLCLYGQSSQGGGLSQQIGEENLCIGQFLQQSCAEVPPMDRNIRILIVDEHTVMRCSLVAFFKCESGMEAIAEAGNGIEAVERFRTLQPDVTLMDLRMPQLNGVEAITMIRQEFPNAKIIILTAYDAHEDIYRGLQAGAKGYLLKKDTSCNELLEAIRQVHEGKKYIPVGVGAKLADRIEYSTLSERECDVLLLVAKGRSNRAIAAALSISEGTVKSHLHQILSKLQADDRTQAVVIALKRGIISI